MIIVKDAVPKGLKLNCLFQVLLEPYSRAYYYGPNRVSKRYSDEPIHPEFTYEAIKAECEADYPGNYLIC